MSVTTHTLKQGASFALTYTFTDEDGNALDLTGFAVTAKGRMQRNTGTTFSFGITNTDLPNGQATLTLSPTVSAALELTQYDIDAKAVLGTTTYYTTTEVLNVVDNIT